MHLRAGRRGAGTRAAGLGEGAPVRGVGCATAAAGTTPRSALALSLHVDFGAHITDIYCDVWFLIAVDQLSHDGTERRVMVQADEAEDGLAAIWDHLSARKAMPARAADRSAAAATWRSATEAAGARQAWHHTT